MLFAALFVPPFASQEAAVRLDHRIATVEAVVHELARKSGRNLVARREMADEALYVNLGGRSPEELMTLVARAATAEWSREGERWVLGRSPSFWRKMTREEASTDAAGLSVGMKPYLVADDATTWQDGSAIAKLVGLTRPGPGGGQEDWQRYATQAIALSPLGRFLSRAIRTIPAAEMAAIPPGVGVRYLLKPNRLGRPLASKAGFAQYLEERRIFVEAFDRLSDAKKGALDGFATTTAREGNAAVALPILHVARSVDGGVRIDLRVLSKAGPAIDFANAEIPASPSHPGQAFPGYAAWAARPLVLGGASASFVRGLNGMGVDPREAARLLDPVGYEPLTALLTEPMDVLVKATAGEAIVALPDEAGKLAGEQLESNPKLGEFADGLGGCVSVEIEGGTIVGRARRPTFSAAIKASRTALRDLLRQGASGAPRLDALARYALAQNPQSPVSEFESLVIHGAGMADLSFGDGGLFSLPYRDVYRIYGSLSPAMKATLSEGRPVPIADLGPATRALLQTMLFVRYTEVEAKREFQSNNFDPTIVVEGFAPGATLGFEDLRRTIVASSTVLSHAEDAGTLGYILEGQESGDSVGSGFPDITKAKFLSATKSDFSVAVTIAEGLRFHGYLSDVASDPGAKAVPYGDLPPEFVKELRRVHDYYRKMRQRG